MTKQTRTAILVMIISIVSTVFVIGAVFFNVLFVQVDPDIALYNAAIETLELQNAELATLVETMQLRETDYQRLIDAANQRIESLQSTAEASRLQSENEALWAEVTRLQEALAENSS